ncbi:MAG: hypothetical protein AB4426_20125 [Xenococcaceae cyanobacterium]
MRAPNSEGIGNRQQATGNRQQATGNREYIAIAKAIAISNHLPF